MNWFTSWKATLLDRWSPVPVTTRAVTFSGTKIACIRPRFVPPQVVHTVPVPRGACPVSGSPIAGTVEVEYQPQAHTLEVVTLHRAVQQVFREATSVEGAAAEITRQVGVALNSPRERGASFVLFTVYVDLWVRPGPQRVCMEISGPRSDLWEKA